MQVKRNSWNKAVLSVALVTIMALGSLQAGVAFASGPAAALPGAATTTAASVTTAETTAASAPVSTAAPATTEPSATGTGPHPGTLDVYEPVPGGATTEDPAVAYDTTSYEVILNVYQTLVNYNGSTTASFVPTLATCVPTQGDQCAQDYGAGFTGVFNATGKNFTGTNGAPKYWTFVIDPQARFYDPTTKASWGVYPTDVMFSIARTLGWTNLPYPAKTAGWIISQSLLPYGSPTWDNGLHYPYNNTPSQIYSSMLINDSAYCPAKAMNGVAGHGCITFVANGTGQYWPEFLDFVADNLGGSVVPCGWFTYQDAGLPGWSGTGADKGDGSCKLPNGGTSTDNSAWTTYLGSLAPTSWDSFELQVASSYPAPQPSVRWHMVGSGPYYASVNPGLSYTLGANPDYAQPVGCSGAGGLAKYVGYCDPAPGKYIPNVDVIWETAEEGDSLGTNAILAGTADFAGIYTTQTSTLLGFVKSGLWDYSLFPTLSTGFTPINLGIDYSAYNDTFAGTPLEANPIPETAFSDVALRNFYVNSYPYKTIQDSINTVDGIQYSFNAGGPIPYGMGNYYPGNVSWPYLRGDPSPANVTTPGSAAWWWKELTTLGSPYYNATLVADCTSSNPCTWPIGYFDGEPANLAVISDWAGEIRTLSGGALSPWPLSESFTQFLTSLVGAYESPLASVVGFGWAPDYPDPTDYMTPMAQPNGAYTGPDTFSQQLTLPQYEQNTSCGHYGTTWANLTYWAKQAQDPAAGTFTDACQGVAYAVASAWMATAGATSAGAQRILEYNQIEQITNGLGMYVYNGQTNELTGFAPWIKASSLNTNPVIGGGGDQVWFQVAYNSVYTVTVQETGLTSGTSWSATVGTQTLSSTTNSIVFAEEPNGTYNFSVSFEAGHSVTPSNGTLTVAGSDVTQSVTYAAFTGPTADVYFNETGLVTGTAWSVVVWGFGAISGANPSLVVALPATATYHYTALLVLDYTPPPPGSFTLGTTPLSVLIVYGPYVNPTYVVTFTETGLPVGSSWSMTVGPPATAYTITAKTPSISFYETNGSYPVSFGLPTGYVGPAPDPLVVVNGAGLKVAITCAATGSAFNVAFPETGLTTGIAWNVTIDNLTVNAATKSLLFTLPNGLYNWTITPPSGWVTKVLAGNVTVRGKAVSLPATVFTQYTFAVTFSELGLPSGQYWGLSVQNGTEKAKSYSTVTPAITVDLPNGSFNYEVGAVPHYGTYEAIGSGAVSNGAVSVVLVFEPTYTVSFTASGLSKGATWTVNFNGLTKSGAQGTSISFEALNNTWTFAASASGYTASPAAGSVVVAGKNASVAISFATSKVAWSYLGTLAYAIIGALVILTIIGFALAARYAGRRPPAAPPAGWKEGASGSTEASSSTSGGTPPPGNKST